MDTVVYDRINTNCPSIRTPCEALYQELRIDIFGLPTGNSEEPKIQVQGLPPHDKGEFEALKLYRSGGFELIVSDDRKFLNYLDRNGIPYLTSSSIIVYLLYKNKISKEDTIKYIDNLKMYISKRQYLMAISEVQKWEK